jgi:rubrerythrin
MAKLNMVLYAVEDEQEQTLLCINSGYKKKDYINRMGRLPKLYRRPVRKDGKKVIGVRLTEIDPLSTEKLKSYREPKSMELRDDGLHCPTCGELLYDEQSDYCPYCGQRLKKHD